MRIYSLKVSEREREIVREKGMKLENDVVAHMVGMQLTGFPLIHGLDLGVGLPEVGEVGMLVGLVIGDVVDGHCHGAIVTNGGFCPGAYLHLMNGIYFVGREYVS